MQQASTVISHQWTDAMADAHADSHVHTCAGGTIEHRYGSQDSSQSDTYSCSGEVGQIWKKSFELVSVAPVESTHVERFGFRDAHMDTCHSPGQGQPIRHDHTTTIQILHGIGL